MTKDWLATANSYINDYLYGVADDWVKEQFADKIEGKEEEHAIDARYDELVAYVKENVGT